MESCQAASVSAVARFLLWLAQPWRHTTLKTALLAGLQLVVLGSGFAFTTAIVILTI
jgi:hypothetical protein